MRRPHFVLIALISLTAPVLAGDDFSIPWHTVDGGGEILSVGGDFE